MKTKTVTVAIEFRELPVSPCFGCPAQASGTLRVECDLVFGGAEIEACVPDHWEVKEVDFVDMTDLQLWIDYDWSGRHFGRLGEEAQQFHEVPMDSFAASQILDQPIGYTVSQVYRRWPHEPTMTRHEALSEHLLDLLDADICETAVEIAERDE